SDAVEQGDDAIGPDRVAGDAVAQIVGHIAIPAADGVERDPACGRPAVIDVRADRLQAAVAGDRERRQCAGASGRNGGAGTESLGHEQPTFRVEGEAEEGGQRGRRGLLRYRIPDVAVFVDRKYVNGV